MHILNLRTDDKTLVSFSSPIQKILVDANVPIIGISGGISYFRKTERLKREINLIPKWMKMAFAKEVSEFD